MAAFCTSRRFSFRPTLLLKYEPAVAEGRAALGEAAFAAAWAEGRTVSLDQAVDYALGER